MSKSRARYLADLLNPSGQVTSSGLADGAAVPTQTGNAGKFLKTDGTNASWEQIVVDDEVAIGATAPSSPFEGQLWYDTTVDALKAYNSTTWLKVSPVLPTVSSISGNIFVGNGGNITITGTGFLSGSCAVKFSGGFTTTTVNVTASNDTTLVVSLPSVVYASTGTVNVTITNSDGGQSPNAQFNVINYPSGGTLTTSGSTRIHTFTSSGSFVNTLDNLAVEYLVVAGGGGGGTGVSSGNEAGGAGAGGLLSGTATLSNASYPVVVGGGGSADNNGSNSTALSLTAIGGGAGGGTGATRDGSSGGSGGGGAHLASYGSGTNGQGYRGGSGAASVGGGGGGAGGSGYDAAGGLSNGGNGVYWNGAYYAGGGGGMRPSGNASNTSGGLGGGGGGARGGNNPGGAATANTGGGGGGSGSSNATYLGGSGGSGIVIIRYTL
jgi:hypothetical protein